MPFFSFLNFPFTHPILQLHFHIQMSLPSLLVSSIISNSFFHSSYGSLFLIHCSNIFLQNSSCLFSHFSNSFISSPPLSNLPHINSQILCYWLFVLTVRSIPSNNQIQVSTRYTDFLCQLRLCYTTLRQCFFYRYSKRICFNFHNTHLPHPLYLFANISPPGYAIRNLNSAFFMLKYFI